jgi:hypothetical protein
MQDVLIALQTDLASSIAIRYTCGLEKLARFNIQAIHIPDMDKEGHSHGSGWVHETWKNAIVRQAREDIAELVQKELFYYSIGEPKIVPGERDSVILEEIRHNHYTFFIEGLLHSFEPARFFQKLESRLYKNLPCPVLMVKNMVELGRGVQIMGTPETIPSLLPWFFKLFSDLPGEPDFLICQFDTSVGKVAFIENDRHLLSDIEDRFSKRGKKPGRIRTAKGSPAELSLLIRDHALTISNLPQHHNNMAIMLSLSPCPVMLCPNVKTD